MTDLPAEPKPGFGSRAKKKLARLALWIAILIPAGEILVRTVEHFLAPSGSLYSLIVPRPGGRFVLRPNADLTVPERYGDIRYRLNREGYRDADRVPNEKSTRRVLLLGDSVTFGLGVAQDRIYAALLGQELARRGGGSIEAPPEVINLAIFAYDSLDELAAFEEDGAKYRPDTVVLQFYLNDFAVRLKAARTSTGGTSAPAPSPTFGPRLIAVKNRVLFGSALYRRLNQAVAGLSYRLFHDLRRERYPETLSRDEIRADDAYLAEHPADATVPTFDAIARIRQAAEAKGARFLVFLSPDEVQLFDRTFDRVTERILRFCAAEGIACFDPLPAFRARSDKAQLFLDGVHYSTHGHAVVAGLLADELARRGSAE